MSDRRPDAGPPSRPDLSREAALGARGFARVAGIDEVGRGPLAGPVVAGAVVLDPARVPPGIDDSKRLPARARERLDAALRGAALVGVGAAGVEEIDRLGIGAATRLAMARAVAALPLPPDAALVDGRDDSRLGPLLGMPAWGIVGGDRLSLSVAAASVVAKVWRDALMVALGRQHPPYGWARNKGYGSKEHIAALQRHGPTPFHRRSFAPVSKMLWQGPIEPPPAL